MKIRQFAANALAIALTVPAHAQESGQRVPVDVPDQPMRILIPEQDRKARPPLPLSRQIDWVTDADYPPEAWRNGEQGRVQYDLVVSSEGEVTGCRVWQSTATPALDAETCRLLRERARFEPGKDGEGKPVSSSFRGAVNWERRQPELGAGSFTIKVAFTIDERGKASNCRMVERSGDIPDEIARNFERNPCPSRNGIPYRDAQGRPVARDVVLTIAAESMPSASGAAQPGD
ncbi:energy transducer TonB [Erythrobacter sp. NE805]|uniref:energy transducer TonB n=1 Tax=Erythrobacter sp. NE805 TaxID=3389875 RepID=UPI00396B2891